MSLDDFAVVAAVVASAYLVGGISLLISSLQVMCLAIRIFVLVLASVNVPVPEDAQSPPRNYPVSALFLLATVPAKGHPGRVVDIPESFARAFNMSTSPSNSAILACASSLASIPDVDPSCPHVGHEHVFSRSTAALSVVLESGTGRILTKVLVGAVVAVVDMAMNPTCQIIEWIEIFTWLGSMVWNEVGVP